MMPNLESRPKLLDGFPYFIFDLSVESWRPEWPHPFVAVQEAMLRAYVGSRQYRVEDTERPIVYNPVEYSYGGICAGVLVVTGSPIRGGMAFTEKAAPPWYTRKPDFQFIGNPDARRVRMTDDEIKSCKEFITDYLCFDGAFAQTIILFQRFGNRVVCVKGKQNSHPGTFDSADMARVAYRIMETEQCQLH